MYIVLYTSSKPKRLIGHLSHRFTTALPSLPPPSIFDKLPQVGNSKPLFYWVWGTNFKTGLQMWVIINSVKWSRLKKWIRTVHLLSYTVQLLPLNRCNIYSSKCFHYYVVNFTLNPYFYIRPPHGAFSLVFAK